AVAFPPVRPATNPAKRSAFVDQESDRAALTLVRIGGDETLARARRHFARFCADEIARLLRAAPRISAKGERRTLQADDICVLVHRRAEANPLVEELRRAQIPYS